MNGEGNKQNSFVINYQILMEHVKLSAVRTHGDIRILNPIELKIEGSRENCMSWKVVSCFKVGILAQAASISFENACFMEQ